MRGVSNMEAMVSTSARWSVGASEMQVKNSEGGPVQAHAEAVDGYTNRTDHRLYIDNPVHDLNVSGGRRGTCTI